MSEKIKFVKVDKRYCYSEEYELPELKPNEVVVEDEDCMHIGRIIEKRKKKFYQVVIGGKRFIYSRTGVEYDGPSIYIDYFRQGTWDEKTEIITKDGKKRKPRPSDIEKIKRGKIVLKSIRDEEGFPDTILVEKS